MVSVIWNDISIPIYCLHLDNNRGNSNSNQRIELIKWFTQEFPNIKVEYILADREFHSQAFISFLNKQHISFIFRTKYSVLATDGNKKVKISKHS